jgi:hypothetical protein
MDSSQAYLFCLVADFRGRSLVPDLTADPNRHLELIGITDFVGADKARPELTTVRHVFCEAEAADELRRLNVAGRDIIEYAKAGHPLHSVSIDHRQFRFYIQPRRVSRHGTVVPSPTIVFMLHLQYDNGSG